MLHMWWLYVCLCIKKTFRLCLHQNTTFLFFPILLGSLWYVLYHLYNLWLDIVLNLQFCWVLCIVLNMPCLFQIRDDPMYIWLYLVLKLFLVDLLCCNFIDCLTNSLDAQLCPKFLFFKWNHFHLIYICKQNRQ